jgi:hypothetical protein
LDNGYPYCSAVNIINRGIRRMRSIADGQRTRTVNQTLEFQKITIFFTLATQTRLEMKFSSPLLKFVLLTSQRLRAFQ